MTPQLLLQKKQRPILDEHCKFLATIITAELRYRKFPPTVSKTDLVDVMSRKSTAFAKETKYIQRYWTSRALTLNGYIASSASRNRFDRVEEIEYD